MAEHNINYNGAVITSTPSWHEGKKAYAALGIVKEISEKNGGKHNLFLPIPVTFCRTEEDARSAFFEFAKKYIDKTSW